MLGSNKEISRAGLNLNNNHDNSLDLATLAPKDKKANQLNTEVEKPKIDEKTPLSIALVDGKIQQKDLFAQINAKAAKLGLSQFNDQALEGTAAKTEELVDSLFSSPQDSAKLSTLASQSMPGEKTKLEKTQRSLQDWNEVISDDNAEAKKKTGVENATLQQTRGQAPLTGDSQLAKEVLSKYITAYSQNLVAPSPEKKKECDALKEQLIDDGFPKEKLKTAEKKIEKLIYNDLKQKAIDTHIKLCLAYNKHKLNADAVQQNQIFNSIKEYGKKFGFLIEKNDMDDIKAEANAEVHSMISNEMDKALVANVLEGRIDKIAQEFEKFNAPATNTSFKTSEYIKEIGKKFDHLGLKPLFNLPDIQKRGIIDTRKNPKQTTPQKLKTLFRNFASGKAAETKAGKDSKQGKNEKNPEIQQNAEEEYEEFTELQEGETPQEKIRNIYIQLLIKKDLKTQINLRLELAKAVYKFEIDKTELKALKTEAEAIARFKLMDLLRESFEEKASLAQLKGPAYELVQKKLKTALSGLKTLGVKPEKKELLKLRDHVNKTMFSLIKEEYIKVELYLEADPPNKAAAKNRRNELLGMLNRLKSESSITEEIRPKEFQDITLKSETNIVDVA